MTWKAWASSRNGARTVGALTVLAAIGIVELLIRLGVINRFIVPLPSQIAAAIPRIIVEEHVLQRFGQTFLEVAWASLLLVAIGVPLGMLLYRYRLVRLATETWVGALAAAPIVLMYPLFLVIFGRSTTTIVMIGFAAGLAPVILKTLEGLAGTPGPPQRRSQLQSKHGAAIPMILLPAALPATFGRSARLDLRDDQHRRRRVPDQLRRLGQLINELAERYDMPGVRSDLLCGGHQHRVLRRHRAG
jgi:ABC-type nitrate/sulfonate/bicarbonate transport system permease component